MHSVAKTGYRSDDLKAKKCYKFKEPTNLLSFCVKEKGMDVAQMLGSAMEGLSEVEIKPSPNKYKWII